MTRALLILLVLAVSIWAVGCEQAAPQPLPASTEVRAKRVAYSGAPPVIPHSPISGKCTTCHSRTGVAAPGVGSGFAPANPHLSTAGLGEHSRCKQCHVFARTDRLFAENEFEGLQRATSGKRAYQGAPPVMPHHFFMREDCVSCHNGPAARPEIRCTHPERTRCLQCHLKIGSPEGPQLAEAI